MFKRATANANLSNVLHINKVPEYQQKQAQHQNNSWNNSCEETANNHNEINTTVGKMTPLIASQSLHLNSNSNNNSNNNNKVPNLGVPLISLYIYLSDCDTKQQQQQQQENEKQQQQDLTHGQLLYLEDTSSIENENKTNNNNIKKMIMTSSQSDQFLNATHELAPQLLKTTTPPAPTLLQDHFQKPLSNTTITTINNNYVNIENRNTHNTHTNNNNNSLLQPNQQQQQQQQKVRSFSHSSTLCPSISPISSHDRHSLTGCILENNQNEENDQSTCPLRPQTQSDVAAAAAAAAVVASRPRRLSRIEHRQSLHDLGYGQIESYFKLQRLGKGTYATVYMGRSRMSNDLVALKEILKEHDEGAPCTAIREVSLLRLLRHNNIVTLHDICHTPKKLTLVFEYVGPDLYAYMKENNNLLSIHNVRLLLYQLLRGIAFCHSRQVLHRDLKPQNLLINSRGELKICDFGLARAKSIPTKSYSNEVVTLWYRPPDVLLGNTEYDCSIDMWGVGCILYEMASGRTFFPGSSVRQQLYLIFSSLGAPNKHNWPEVLTNPDYQSYSFPPFKPEKLSHRVPRLDASGLLLLMSFLRFKPSERISAEDAKRHAFFSCLPEQVHHLNERESIFDVPGVYMTLNPGQKLNSHHI